MRFVTNTDWEIIQFDVRPVAVGGNGLNFDNMNLQYRPSLGITSKVCINPTIPPLPPENTNLIYNPLFNLGLSGWQTSASLVSSVTSGVLKLNFPGVVSGWFTQFLTNPLYPLRAGLTMNAWVTVSNTDNVAKPMQFMVRDAYFTNTYLCTFLVPANTSNLIYSMKFKTVTDWQMIRADMRVATVDSAGLHFDYVNLRWQPWLTLAGNKECVAPSPDESPTLPPDTELVLVE
jgi:hypothetical protein